MQNVQPRQCELKHQDCRIYQSQDEERPLNFHRSASQGEIPRYCPPMGDGSIASAYNLETVFRLDRL